MEASFEYDSQVDALYIYFKKPTGQVATRSLTEDKGLAEDVAMDFDEDEKIVGIEILGASQYFPKNQLLSEDVHRLSTVPGKATFKKPILM